MAIENTPDGPEEVRSVSFTDGGDPVTARKLVSMGELLVLERGEDQLRLDAMLLEGLSWQRDASDLADAVTDSEAVRSDPVSSYDNRSLDATDSFGVSNEYTTVTLEVVAPEGTDALQVRSEKGVSVLGPETLGALTTIDSTLALSTWFQTPIGPEQPL